jgi:hypothetical protein
MGNWLLVGHISNWDIALKEHTWGLTNTYTNAQLAQRIENADRVFFYATSPVTGIVGSGRVEGKAFEGDKPLWPVETQSDQVIFVHRFKFRVTRVLDRDAWKSRRIRLIGRAMAPGLLRGIIQISDEDAEWISKQEENWKTHHGRLFLSHSHADREFCEKLAEDLRHEGVFVWTDEAEMQIGDSLIRKISEAIDETDYLVVILSKSSVKSRWVRKEVDIAMTQEIRGKRVKVLPVLLEDCVIPSFLKDKVYADFRDILKYGVELKRIVKRVSCASR